MTSPTAPRRQVWQPFLTFGLPTLLLIAWVILPLLRGSDTLFLRDIFSTHLPMKAAQAEAMRQGHFPLLDPYRAGGQPLAGNPNAVPFYPDNLLYLLGDGARGTLWALNAHFWLHWLLAVPAMFLLGRALGWSRSTAWASGALWATSGYFVSQLNFYNLVAGVALTPAFLGAWIRLRTTASQQRGRWLAATGLLWALLLVAGDPLLAAMALAMALLASLLGVGSPELPAARPESEPLGARRPHLGRRGLVFLGALALGTLVAAPQWIEFLRVLPTSFRALYGYSHASALVSSLDPRQLFDLLLPLPFGRPDQLGVHGFWGHRLYSGVLPYYWSLYPGLATLGLVAAAGLPRKSSEGKRDRRLPWAWLLIAGGLFVALGRFNPLAAWLFDLPGLRYPVKFWLPVALGTAVLAGCGFEAAWGRRERTHGPARRRFLLALGAAALMLTGALLVAVARPAFVVSWLAQQQPAGPVGAGLELARWAGTALGLLTVAAALAYTLWLGRRRPALAGALLLVIHAVAQLVFLRPLIPMDASLHYRLEPALLDQTTPANRLTHGAAGRLFGSSTLYQGRYPSTEARWLTRRAYAEQYPPTGPLLNREYALNVSPEGLSGFHTSIAREAVAAASDPERLRLLAAWGVDRLILDRPLALRTPGPLGEGSEPASLLSATPGFGQTRYLYSLPAAAPARLATRVHHSDGPGATYRLLTDPAFDPRSELVVEGAPELKLSSDPERIAQPATVRVLSESPERAVFEVRAPAGGVLALRRSFLPLYRASVDRDRAETLLVNMHQLGIAVPPGNHQVELWVHRTPLAFGFLLSLLGGFGLLFAWQWTGRDEAPESTATEAQR